MDYIREFDIRLEKEMYYAGETLSGVVILDTSENFKVRTIRVLLRGKAHTEWKVMVSGDKRTVNDDQYFIDDRATIWGKEKAEGTIPILPRGMHQFPFRFQLPESSLPCSFESRAGTIRYYLKVTVDIPYASPPQGMKYFTIIGPHIDCMDYLRPIRGETKRRRCCLCCESGRVSLRTDFERSAYVCGEALRVKADIDNQSEEEVRLKLRLVQHVAYFIDRGVLGVQKEVSNTILEYRGAPISSHSRTKWDSQQNLAVPTMPPTLVGICRLITIYYMLKVSVELEKSGEDLHMHFPFTIATVPFRIPNSNQQTVISYEVACDHAEGGMYIGPEFLLGQVYDGTSEFGESIVLYRPVYPTVKSNKGVPNNASSSSQPQSLASTPSATKGLKVEFPKEGSTTTGPIVNQPQSLLHQNQKATTSQSTCSSNLITTTATSTTTTISSSSSTTAVVASTSKQLKSTSSSGSSIKNKTIVFAADTNPGPGPSSSSSLLLKDTKNTGATERDKSHNQHQQRPIAPLASISSKKSQRTSSSSSTTTVVGLDSGESPSESSIDGVKKIKGKFQRTESTTCNSSSCTPMTPDQIINKAGLHFHESNKKLATTTTTDEPKTAATDMNDTSTTDTSIEEMKAVTKIPKNKSTTSILPGHAVKCDEQELGSGESCSSIISETTKLVSFSQGNNS